MPALVRRERGNPILSEPCQLRPGPPPVTGPGDLEQHPTHQGLGVGIGRHLIQLEGPKENRSIL